MAFPLNLRSGVRSPRNSIDPDSVPAPELGGAFADTELNAYVGLRSGRSYSLSPDSDPDLYSVEVEESFLSGLVFAELLSSFLGSEELNYIEPILLMRMLSLIPGLAEASFPCLWFTPRLSEKIYAVSRLPSLLQSRLLTIGNTRIRLSLSCPRSYFLSKLSLHSAIPTTGQA